MEFSKHDVSPKQLLLDPNNYRFHDLVGYKRVSQRDRYAEPGVQERALQLLQTTKIIRTGRIEGFNPYEWVCSY